MALLNVAMLGLRGKNIRCVGATLLVVVFFTGAFLVVLKHTIHPTTRSAVAKSQGAVDYSSLDSEEAIQYMTLHYQSDKDLALRGLKPKPTKGTEKKHHGHGNNHNKNNKKPDTKSRRDNVDKAEGSRHRNVSSKHDINSKQAANNITKERQPDREGTETKQRQTEREGTQKNVSTEVEPKTLVESGIKLQIANTVEQQPSTAKEPVKPAVPQETGQGLALPQSRFQTPLSTLKTAPVQSFASPFIESDVPQAKLQKKIITWYQPQGNDLRELNRKKRILKNCPEPKCKLVYPLPGGLRADAVVFTEGYRTGPPPPRVDGNQVFILYGREPISMIQENAWPGAWKSAFNWTWSYRRDSDIWQPFGQLKPADDVPAMEFFSSLTEDKTSPIAWIPRTCPLATSSKRDEFVEELRKHVPVEEFGGCLNSSTCAKDNKTCSEILSSTFFFLLALEDDLCKDYVTEVFYRAWQEGTHIIPVVRGGTDYSSFFPEGTYVNAGWFNDMKELYDFLAELMTEKKLYSQLLWRKAHWVKASKQAEEQAMCHLCYKLHHLAPHRKMYPDISQWFQGSECKIAPPAQS